MKYIVAETNEQMYGFNPNSNEVNNKILLTFFMK